MSSRTIENRIAVTLAVFSWAASSSAETLTLDEAVSLAIGNNRGLRISALETQKAQDRLEAAIKEYEAALSVEPRSSSLHALLGTARLKNGEPELARKHFEEGRNLALHCFLVALV